MFKLWCEAMWDFIANFFIFFLQIWKNFKNQLKIDEGIWPTTGLVVELIIGMCDKPQNRVYTSRDSAPTCL